MAIAFGTLNTSRFTTSGRSSDTVSVTQPAGSDKYILVAVYMNNTDTVSSVTYGGDALTALDSLRTFPIINETIRFYGLATTKTGANNVVINYSAPVFNPSISISYPMTGVNSITNFSWTTGTLPQSPSITVSANSYIIADCGCDGNPVPTITIDGSSRTLDYDYNPGIYNETFGARSASLSAGSRTVTVDSTPAQSAGIYVLEVVEAGAAPSITSKNTQAVWL